ncbi:hypothetical protein L2E82_40400 [Cichorium intybus]|uniref:Uncharacterized protein n=1 Tax=Cichorium intybus TaxID=13427 RepID=A0ACB9AML7_CICIN|nr:hypothetical protein L2E82_40400 [Cichorium intybus]
MVMERSCRFPFHIYRILVKTKPKPMIKKILLQDTNAKLQDCQMTSSINLQGNALTTFNFIYKPKRRGIGIWQLAVYLEWKLENPCYVTTHLIIGLVVPVHD